MHKNRDAWVEIDLGSLEKNIEIIKGWLLDSRDEKNTCGLMGIVKADAYGHGAIAVAEVLQAKGVEWLGVASVGEGRQLRGAGIDLPILILGPCPGRSILTAIENNLDLAVTSLAQLKEIARQTDEKNKICRIQLKIDTGMHRLGFQPDCLSEVFRILDSGPQLKLIGVFSHLAKADDVATTTRQDVIFKRALKMFEEANHKPQFVHLASSEAVRHFPFVRYDMVRMGINLYGLEPKTISADLMPVMAVRGRINQLNYIEKGESIGYGLTWRAERKTLLASVPIGYADGIDRRLSNCMKGLINGKFIDQVGRISMDQMLFDVTEIEDVEEGNVVTLIGSQYYGNRQNVDEPRPSISLADWSTLLNTITYELACRLKLRLTYVFSRTNVRRSIDQEELV
jgi:alanine racemase